jgi:hypothetical protein
MLFRLCPFERGPRQSPEAISNPTYIGASQSLPPPPPIHFPKRGVGGGMLSRCVCGGGGGVGGEKSLWAACICECGSLRAP